MNPYYYYNYRYVNVFCYSLGTTYCRLVISYFSYSLGQTYLLQSWLLPLLPVLEVGRGWPMLQELRLLFHPRQHHSQKSLNCFVSPHKTIESLTQPVRQYFVCYVPSDLSIDPMPAINNTHYYFIISVLAKSSIRIFTNTKMSNCSSGETNCGTLEKIKFNKVNQWRSTKCIWRLHFFVPAKHITIRLGSDSPAGLLSHFHHLQNYTIYVFNNFLLVNDNGKVQYTGIWYIQTR